MAYQLWVSRDGYRRKGTRASELRKLFDDGITADSIQEPLAQDHQPLVGGGPQIAVDGPPFVEVLEQWEDRSQRWEVIWISSKNLRET